MSCLPSQHTLDEVELLLQELQLRMTRAVEVSPHLNASLQEPHVLYTALAEFFEAQHTQAQRAKDVALDAVDVQRVWAFCLAELASSGAAHSTSTPATDAPSRGELSHVEPTAQTLHEFVHSSLSLPLEALQRHAPAVHGKSLMRTSSDAFASSSSCTPSSRASPISVFSIVRPVFAKLTDLAYVADQRLQRPSSSATISVLSLAALAASLVPTLDRVQVVRLTAQIADELVSSRITSSDGSALPPCSRPAAAALLAGVWYVWGVLDSAHSTALHSLGERLFQRFALSTRGSMASDMPMSSFTAWLQPAFRENKGALHQELYAEAPRGEPLAKAGAGGVDAAPVASADKCGTAGIPEGADSHPEFWAWLSS
ncbi:hypothetical protein LSCM1_06031 [Leishmania martiniquensis]|uniref:Uncharacterized protein n=1 Tax=Leishmania martiniquensis TaxID=1580590 RepID=A0A836KUG3_9TRYP|nr:hypothetical protein LSCM1_06031 [Leishmania martiniquensis]